MRSGVWWLLAALSAILLVLSFPPYDVSVLAPFALTPLLIACAREPDWRRRFGLGYLCGILYWFGLCHWIQWTLSQYAGTGAAAAWGLFALFCLAKAVQLGIFGVLAGFLWKSRFALPLLAALWVATEWTHSYTGFEWLNLGNAASEMSIPLRMAPYTGVWGLSFFFALLSAATAGAILRRSRFQLAWVCSILILLLLPEIPPAQRGTSNAVLLQPNQSESTVWSPELVSRSLRRMTMLSLGQTLQGRAPDLIVWPEDPGPFYDYDPAYTGVLQGLATTSGASVVAGGVGRSAAGAPLNSAIVMSPQGKLVSRYDKVNLVPFGEFVPWPFKELTKQVSTEAGDFEAGARVVVSQTGGHELGTFICYESVFPSFIRKFVQQGAQVLVNISNDGWFGHTAARYQHLRIVRMRAVENRRWVLRATNNGVTVAIDPAGRVMQTAPEYLENATKVGFRYLTGMTFYTDWGDWFVGVCWAGVAAGMMAIRRVPAHL